MANKQDTYNAATQKLIEKAQRIDAQFDFALPYNIADTVKKIRAAFQNKNVRQKILNPKWEKIDFQDERYSAGFCSIASYIIGHTFTPPHRPSPWAFYQFTDVPTFGNHIWLQFIPTGDIFDITFDQFTDFNGAQMDIPYHLGKQVNAKYQHAKAYDMAEQISPELAAILRQNTINA